MKILVTGGAGFIGSHIVDGYIADGHEVAVLDNLSTGFRHNVNNTAKFYNVSVCDHIALAGVMADFKPEIVNHHAAQMDVRRSTREPVFDANVNILGSLNLIIESVRVGVRHFIYASIGGAVYGEVTPNELPITEDHPVNPICQYGISKHTVEHYLYLYRRLENLQYTVLRYPNVFGPRQNPRGEAGVVAIFAQQLISGEPCTIFGDGTKTRDYVYVSDIVRANLIAAKMQAVGIFNLGWGRGVSDLEVYNIVANAVNGERLPITFAAVRPGEVQAIALNPKKARVMLGWLPNVLFADGVRTVVDSFARRWIHSSGARATE